MPGWLVIVQYMVALVKIIAVTIALHRVCVSVVVFPLFVEIFSLTISISCSSTVLMRTEESPLMLSSMLRGYHVCILLAARFRMDSEVALYVSSLAAFTGLTFSAAVGTEPLLTMKNIQGLKVGKRDSRDSYRRRDSLS